MEKNIVAIVSNLRLATFDEIKSLLSAQLGVVRDETLKYHLRALCEKFILLNVLPEENSAQLQGYVLGPGIDAEQDVETKRLVLDSDVSARSYDIVDWGVLCQRLLKKLAEDAASLKEDILKLCEPPKKLEMRYFDLTIKYHSLYRFFYEKTGFELSDPTINLLNECKSCLSKLQF